MVITFMVYIRIVQALKLTCKSGCKKEVVITFMVYKNSTSIMEIKISIFTHAPYLDLLSMITACANAAVLKICFNKLSDWQAGPLWQGCPLRSLLTHTHSL